MSANLQTHTVQLDNTVTKLSVTLKQPNEAGVLVVTPLTGKTVKVLIINAATFEVILAETDTGVSVVSEAAGTVDYDFAAAAVDEPGIYWVYFNVYTGSEYETFPVEQGNLQLRVNSLTMTAEAAYKIQLAKGAVGTTVLEFDADSVGRNILTNFPPRLTIGDSYSEDLLNQIKIYVRTPTRTAVTGVGSQTFVDSDFSAELTISQQSPGRLVRADVVWVPAVGATEGYFKVEFSSQQTGRAAEGYATMTLRFKWGSLVVTAARQGVEWVSTQ